MAQEKITIHQWLLLGALLKCPPERTFGYAIHQWLRKNIDFHIAVSTMYAVLNQLKTLGYASLKLESSPEAKRHGRPPRTYYHITPKGEQVFNDIMKSVKNIF